MYERGVAMKLCFKKKCPIIGEGCLVFENSTLVGDVKLGKGVSIWPYATLRGDMDLIEIGDHTNIQESSVVHTNFNMPVIIGSNVTVGHNAIIHAATVGNDCLIGMGAIILDEAVVEDGAIVAAGCVVPPGKVVPKNHLAVGNPMKVVKELDEKTRKVFTDNTKAYVELTKQYLEECE